MAKKNKKNPVSFLAILKIAAVLALVALVFAACRQAFRFFTEADFFEIKEVVCHPSLQFLRSEDFDYVKGKNLFSVDLKKLERNLKFRYPQIDQPQVLRRPPNQIFIYAKDRMPFALIKTGDGLLAVDSDGIVASNHKASALTLPVVDGVNISGLRIQPDAKLKDRKLQLALWILKAFRSNRALLLVKIITVDVGNLSKIELGTEQGITIIVDQDNMNRQLDMLALLLSQTKINFNVIDYVDIRFKEPIFAKKAGSSS